MLPVNKILCPTDFSEPSYKALNIANEMAKQFSAELILVHVLSPLQVFPAATGFPTASPGGAGVFSADMINEIREQALKSLEMTLNEKVSEEVKSSSDLLQGSGAEQIAEYAETHDVDVIIMGTHGFTGWRHLILGSVTEKVVRLSSCPVLTIPADRDQ